MNESLVQGLEACHLLSWIIKINSVSKSLSRDGTERYEIAKILMLFQILPNFQNIQIHYDSLRASLVIEILYKIHSTMSDNITMYSNKDKFK